MSLIIYQGETTTFRFRPKVDGEYYTLTANDKIIFGIKSSTEDKNYVVNKVLTSASYDSNSNSYVMVLSASDTESIAAATYMYDVGLQLGNTSAANYYYIKKPAYVDVIGTVTKRQLS